MPSIFAVPKGLAPKPKKKRAIHALDRIDILWDTSEFSKETMEDINAIRRALESLPDSQD